MLAKRHRFLVNGHEVDPAHQDTGGIHMYGLCKDCNQQAGLYDAAYGEFATLLSPYCALLERAIVTTVTRVWRP